MEDINQNEAAARDIAMEDYRDNIAEVADRLRFQVEFSQSALKNLHLVNGGAILALLTFLGNSNVQFDLRPIWWAFLWFSVGLFASLAAYFGAYFSQASFMNVSAKQAWNAQLRARGKPPQHSITSDHKIGNCYLYLGIGAAVTSLVSFVIGAFIGLGSLT